MVARIAQGRLPSPLPVRPRRDLRAFAVPLLACLAGAAAIAIVYLGRRSPVPAALAARGDVSLVVQLAGQDVPRRLSDGDEVHPGDHLRFEVHAPQAGHMAILSLDARGPTVRHPFAAADPALYDPARPVVPATFEVDDTLGVERLYLVYAPEPFSLVDTARALASGGSLPRGLSAASLYLVKTR